MTEKLLKNLLYKYRVPKHILAHMQKVADVCVYIGTSINKKSTHQPVNLTILRYSALLHDLVKICDFPAIDLQYFQQTVTEEEIAVWNGIIQAYHPLKHALAAAQILKDLGEDELATIVRKHRFGSLLDDKPEIWEEKILYYSDKRVKHDTIVSIQERLEDGRKRYFPDGNIPKEDQLIEQELMKLETEICMKAGIKPDQINEQTIANFRQNVGF